MRKKWGKLLTADLRAPSAAELDLEEAVATLSRDGRLDVGRGAFRRQHASAILKTSETTPDVMDSKSMVSCRAADLARRP